MQIGERFQPGAGIGQFVLRVYEFLLSIKNREAWICLFVKSVCKTVDKDETVRGF